MTAPTQIAVPGFRTRYSNAIVGWLSVVLTASHCLFASAAEGEVSFKAENSRFTSSEVSRNAAADDANKLIAIARERFGVTLDRSENSIVDLQRVAELARGEMQPWRNYTEWQKERDEWAPLLGSYLGEVLVNQRGAHWGTTDFIGGSDRAIGFPKAHNILLPIGQMDKALQFASNICGWYLIDVAGSKTGKTPDAIDQCSKQPWQKTRAEEEHSAAVKERVQAAREREIELRKTSRTSAEIREGVGRMGSRIESVFRSRGVESFGKIIVTLTVSPAGEVTEAHVVSSDFGDPELEEAVLAVVRTLRYESRGVPAYTDAGFAIRFGAPAP